MTFDLQTLPIMQRARRVLAHVRRYPSFGLGALQSPLSCAPLPSRLNVLSDSPSRPLLLPGVSNRRTFSVAPNLSDDLLLSLSLNYNNSGTTHTELCDNLKRNAIIKTPLIEYAFRKTDRAHFDPSPNPYEDAPHDIGGGATITSAHMHAIALEAISRSLVPAGASMGVANHRERTYLDVGCGSGYVTAVLGVLAQSADSTRKYALMDNAESPTSATLGEKSLVIGVDVVPALVEQARRNTKSCSSQLVSGSQPIVQFVSTDVFTPQGASRLPRRLFDCIHVGLALPAAPLSLLALLRPGGQLIAPIIRQDSPTEQDLVVFTRLTNPTADALAPLPTGALPLPSSYTGLFPDPKDSTSLTPLNQQSDTEVANFLSHFTQLVVMRCVYSPGFSTATLDHARVVAAEAERFTLPTSVPDKNESSSIGDALPGWSQSALVKLVSPALDPRLTSGRGGVGATGTAFDKYFKAAASGGPRLLTEEEQLEEEKELERARAEAERLKMEQIRKLEDKLQAILKAHDDAAVDVKKWHADFLSKNERKPTYQEMQVDPTMSRLLQVVRELKKHEEKTKTQIGILRGEIDEDEKFQFKLLNE